jgi:arylsulfatase A-like enzyme
MKKKNVILYLTYSQTFEKIDENSTPNIFALAKDGVTFENNFSCQADYRAVKACLQSGLYATEIDFNKKGYKLPVGAKSLSDCFEENGYNCYNDFDSLKEPFFIFKADFDNNNIDKSLGKLVATLKEKGIYDDTVIAFLNYSHSEKMPLIIKGGSFDNGRIEKGLTSIIDIPPTLLSIANIPVPYDYMGINLANDKRDCVFIQSTKSSRIIITERFKYEIHLSTVGKILQKKAFKQGYLYDLAKDDLKGTNLIKDARYKNIKEDLKYLIIKQMEIAKEEPPVIF